MAGAIYDMVSRFEGFADRHPNVAGTIVALVMVALFGLVGGIERGSIALPF